MNSEKIIAIASDHAGYDMKEQLKKHFDALGVKYIDYGTSDSKTSVDYPDYASKACESIQNGNATLGVLVCGTGIGMSMAANKHKGIRAACCSDTFSARMTRMHNDANMLCIGARVIGIGLATDLVDIFISTEFEGERHMRRIQMLSDIEEKQSL